MKPKSIQVACVSDVHLGHRNTSADFIADNLKQAFPDNQATAQLDIIFIAGDFFDGLLLNNGDDVYTCDNIILYFLRLCKKYEIKLRVLEGTPSHDFGQNRRFVHLNEAAQVGCELKYIPVLSIEKIDEFGISVLYVPDEWEDRPEKTLDQVYELLRLNDLEQVDLAIMHGNFPHQLPAVVKSPKHDPSAYLALVKYLVFIGHVHQNSQYERIWAQGSFDRLAHGEEDAKGHIRATLYQDGRYEAVFVENKGAKIYKTVECRGLTLSQTLEEIAQAIEGLPMNSFVRISCSRNNPILQDLDQLSRTWPLLRWSKLIKDPQAVHEEQSDLAEEEYTPVTITKDNLVKLVMDRIKTHTFSDALCSLAEAVLMEVR